MNALMNFAGLMLYYAFMLFLLPMYAVLILLFACHQLVVFVNQVVGYLGKLAAHFHLVRRHMPARRLGRRLATVHA
ncbi:hypothetical protein [Pseudocnuella soli]|uniref:hypothetical protein n=1 Tax=Pseudocnuella soli TaxID=2502779 RepID=UPI00104DA3C4|nr:hypothetical protein [Pseudocnuella soli]